MITLLIKEYLIQPLLYHLACCRTADTRQRPAHHHTAACHGPLALLHHNQGLWLRMGLSFCSWWAKTRVRELPGPASTTGQYLGMGCAVSSYAWAHGPTRAPVISQRRKQHPEHPLLSLNRNASEVWKAEAKLLSHSTWRYLMLNFNRMPQCFCDTNYWKPPHALFISLKINFCWPNAGL